MAYRKTLITRLVSNLRDPRLHAAGDTSDLAAAGTAVLQRWTTHAAVARPPGHLRAGGQRERLMLAGGNRRRDDGLLPPPPQLSSEDAVRVSIVAEKLREVRESSVSYEELVRICGGEDQGSEAVKALMESGEVFVVGNIVFLRPDQLTKSVHVLIAQTLPKPDDPRKQLLEKMEHQKAEIDNLARTQVRSELFCGFGLLLAQTLTAMRLTFWDLSWDVMEPICFFAVSMHFIAAYTFFLRTSTEPTFEGYFQRRFLTRQRKLMVARKFDFDKYQELRWALYGRELGLGAQLAHYRPNDRL